MTATSTTEGATTKRKRQVVLAAVIASFFGLWCFGVVVREPYPAPIFPRFGSIPENQEIQPVRVQLLAFESGQERVLLPAGDVFDGPFDAFYPQMLDSLVSAEGAEQDFDVWVQDKAKARLGWDCAEALEIVEVVPDGSEPEKTLNRFDFGECG